MKRLTGRLGGMLLLLGVALLMIGLLAFSDGALRADDGGGGGTILLDCNTFGCDGGCLYVGAAGCIPENCADCEKKCKQSMVGCDTCHCKTVKGFCNCVN